MLKKLIFTGFIGISTLFASDSASSISASQALQMLKDGNQRFINGKSIHPHSDFERIKEVSTGLTWLNHIALWLTSYLHSKGHLMVVTLTTARSQL